MIVGITLCVGFLAYSLIIFLDGANKKKMRHWELTRIASPPKVDKDDVIYEGAQNSILFEEVHDILLSHSHYFAALNPGLKKMFIERLLFFMSKKTFIIKDDEAFKEMPVVVSASAIQLTFGLKDYLLPFYKYIQIYPEEYLGRDSFFKILAGNVENNTITVAWNHTLKGNENAADGSNLGLHEMSHALYMQKMVVEADRAKDFGKKYGDLLKCCHKAHSIEVKGLLNVYSSYAESDLQEFWAESTELFFEKPKELLNHHPEVYSAMRRLLNQNPINHMNPVVKPFLTLKERVYVFFGYDKT